MAKFPDKNLSTSLLNTQGEFLRALALGGDCVDYEKLSVGDAAVVTLNVPASAQKAILTVIGDATAANSDRVIHFREDGNNPTTGTSGEGMPIGDNGTYTILSADNLANFKMIGIEAGKTHSVRVQYYA